MRNSLFFTIMALLSSFLLFGCDREVEEFKLHEKVEVGTEIKLPEHPDFREIKDIARQYEDGVFTTWGLLWNRNILMGRDVRVRGVITEISEDCPNKTTPEGARPKKKGKKLIKEGYTCKGLYVMIRSPESDNVKQSMMIVGYHPYFHPHFEIGMELDVTGHYLLKANEFIRSRDGLIQAVVMNNMAVDRKGNFTNDPVEALKWQQRGDQAGTPKF